MLLMGIYTHTIILENNLSFLSYKIEHVHTLKLSNSTLGQISRNKSCTSVPGDMDMNIHNRSESTVINQKEPKKPFNRRMDKNIGAV